MVLVAPLKLRKFSNFAVLIIKPPLVDKYKSFKGYKISNAERYKGHLILPLDTAKGRIEHNFKLIEEAWREAKRLPISSPSDREQSNA